jgi:hypothetical protein
MTQTPANDNQPPAKPGSAYYPEMGERPDGTALFASQIGHGGYYLTWAQERHADALAAFKRLRIRPRYMQLSERVLGPDKWSCIVTWDAGQKLHAAKLDCIELLLD